MTYVLEYMCFHMCVGTRVHMDASVWRTKVDTGNLPQLFFHFILLRQGLWLNLELTNPSKSLASLLQRFPCLHLQRLELQAGYHVNLAFTWGSGHLNFPSSCLLARTSAAKPSSPALSISGRIYLPSSPSRKPGAVPSCSF